MSVCRREAQQTCSTRGGPPSSASTCRGGEGGFKEEGEKKVRRPKQGKKLDVGLKERGGADLQHTRRTAFIGKYLQGRRKRKSQVEGGEEVGRGRT
jgi:hypothetical protein